MESKTPKIKVPLKFTELENGGFEVVVGIYNDFFGNVVGYGDTLDEAKEDIQQKLDYAFEVSYAKACMEYSSDEKVSVVKIEFTPVWFSVVEITNQTAVKMLTEKTTRKYFTDYLISNPDTKLISKL